MCDLDDRTTWHISCDWACTQIEVTQLEVVCGQEDKDLLEGTQPEMRRKMVIQEDQDGDLGLERQSLYM